MTVKILTDKKDIDLAKDIRIKVFVDEQQVPLHLEIDDLDSKENTVHVGLFYNNKMVGVGRILDIGSQNIHLGRIAILKEYRGLGLGEKLVLGMERLACELSKRDLVSHLSAQKRAENFYKKLGYKNESEEIYLDAGIEHLDMQKELKFL
ncbi:GNAT family N-acetyltransferase [Gemella sp. GH3]|uniref:GNAT family N-acetyltransferase n=1 Tax=unclassified Gemella TaxID=2624949 RepID=UPI0015CF9F74|nr:MULTISPECIES: GNAT family N-acetyltransferase [unclassified Gemella]MBF0713628.1 GNAT family N-acetyltransferase [Gemella sp. GH3.1]NYS50580.1 GNAT family N-acetyltransferase [Gemella sp. GH3]